MTLGRLRKVNDRIDRAPVVWQAAVVAVLTVAVVWLLGGDRSTSTMLVVAASTFIGWAVVGYVVRFAVGARTAYQDNRERYPW